MESEGRMKLTEEDKKYLRETYNENDEAIDQIERCIAKTDFTLHSPDFWESRKILASAVLDVLDRESFLSGMRRCAFHRTAFRYTKDGRYITFNSRRFFE